MKWNPGCVEQSRSFKTASLNDENIVASISVLIDPSPDGISAVGRPDAHRPLSSIGKNPTEFVQVVADIGRFGSANNFQGFVGDHHPRHSGRYAVGMLVVPLVSSRQGGDI